MKFTKRASLLALAVLPGCGALLGFEEPQSGLPSDGSTARQDAGAQDADEASLVASGVDGSVPNASDDASSVPSNAVWGFSDTFSSPSTDLLRWSTHASAGTIFTQANNELQIDVPVPGTAETRFGFYETTSTWDLAGAHAAVHVKQPLLQNGRIYISVIDSTNDSYSFAIVNDGSTVALVQKMEGGTSTTFNPTPYAPATYDWLRIRHDHLSASPTDDIVFDCRANGGAWVEFIRCRWTLQSTVVKVSIGAERTGPDPSPMPAAFADFEIRKN